MEALLVGDVGYAAQKCGHGRKGPMKNDMTDRAISQAEKLIQPGIRWKRAAVLQNLRNAILHPFGYTWEVCRGTSPGDC